MCARRFATALCLCVLCGALNSLAGDAQNQPRVYRGRIEPHWSADGKRFWYRNELRGGKREVILVDAENGTRSTAFDAERVAAALIKLGEQGVTAEKLGIESLRFDTDPAVLVLQSKTNAWRLDLKTYSLAPDKPQAQNQASLAPSDRPRPSRRTGDSTTLNFINRTPGEVDGFCLDTAGERKHYAEVKAGESWETNTFDGHVWLVADKSDKMLGVFEATRSSSTAIVGGEAAARQPAPPRNMD